jgi:hypothetical protein
MVFKKPRLGWFVFNLFSFFSIGHSIKERHYGTNALYPYMSIAYWCQFGAVRVKRTAPTGTNKLLVLLDIVFFSLFNV